jgi:hypothetical protein
MVADWFMLTIVSFCPCNNSILGHKSNISSESANNDAFCSIKWSGELDLYPSTVDPIARDMGDIFSTPLAVSNNKWLSISYTPEKLYQGV